MPQNRRCLSAVDFLFTFATSQPAERNMSAALKIFIIYAREDETFKISLLKAFKPLHRTGKIEIFHDGLIKPGERWEEAILENLRTAHIILPLVSTDFFDSEFIHEVEFKKAVDRYNKGETTIIPIILKHCGWRYDPIIPTLQVLPKDGKPVVTWAFHEEAWEQVLDAVHGVTEQEEEKNRLEAKRFFDLGVNATDIHEKIKHYSRAIDLDHQYTNAYNNRGWLKDNLGQFAEAIKDYDQAIRLNPENAFYYNNRGNTKDSLGQYAEAIKDYDQAIRLDPEDAFAYNNRGWTKHNMGLLTEAMEDIEKALEINSNDGNAYHSRGIVKEKLGQLEDALKDYEKALSIEPEHEESLRDLPLLKAKLKSKI